MDKVFWGDYTTYEIKEFIKKDPVVIIPVGAHEQHGPHLAMNTDSVIAENICKAVVEKSQTPCVTLPTIWVGISEHHMKFSGSLTLKQSTMSIFLYDILDSLARHGVRKVLVVNSHGGNAVPLNEALTRASVAYGGTFALLTYWNLISKEITSLRKSETGGISHACEMETSLQLFLDPRNVRKDKIPPASNVKGSSFWSAEMFSSNKITMYRPYDQLSELGHIGDPAKGTVELGKSVFELIVEKTGKLIDTMWKEALLDENY